MTPLGQLTRHSELLQQLTQRELKGRYKRSTLGWAWSLANPLAQMAVFVVVFGVFFDAPVPVGDPSGLEAYALFLMSGFLPWAFLANGVTVGSGALVANANLVKKVWFPRELLVFAVALSGTATFLVELVVLMVGLLLVGNMVLPWIPVLAALILLHFVFVTGLSLVLASATVYLRDLEHLLSVLLQLWFYATPVIYPIVLVTDALEGRGILLDLYRLNPMTRFVEAYRDVLYHLRLPTLGTSLYLVVLSLVMFVVGRAVFSRLEPRMAEEL